MAWQNPNVLILLALFCALYCDRASCIHGASKAELSSPYEGSRPPLYLRGMWQ
jgi:hypothetical protein